MPGYKTHVTWSTLAGIGLGCFAKFVYNVSFPQAIFGGALCALGGVLPDIDSEKSRSYQRCITTISGTGVLLLASRLRDFQMEPEAVIMACAGVYFFIVYVIGSMVKKMTVHRGMCHSIPFAVIVAELIFILSSGDTELRLFKAFCIFLGVMTHLCLDELNSFVIGGNKSSRNNTDNYFYASNNRYGNNSSYGPRTPNDYGYSRNTRQSKNRQRRSISPIRVKKSFGTAIKLIDYKHMGSTIVFYIVAAFLGHCAMGVQDFLQKVGVEDRVELQGMFSVNRVKRLYPTQYDLSVIQWIAENDLVLTPGKKENKKWEELHQLLALDCESADNQENTKTQNIQRLSNNTDKLQKKEAVSLIDVINWNSLVGEEENVASQ